MSSTVDINTPCSECGRTSEDNGCKHEECLDCGFVGCKECVETHEFYEHSSDVTDDIDYEEPMDFTGIEYE